MSSSELVCFRKIKYCSMESSSTLTVSVKILITGLKKYIRKLLMDVNIPTQSSGAFTLLKVNRPKYLRKVCVS